MKRFILFKSSLYYPWGGAEDFFDHVEELPEVVETEEFSPTHWCNALDTHTGKILLWNSELQSWSVSDLRQHQQESQ